MKKIVFFIMLLAGSTMAFGQAGTQSVPVKQSYGVEVVIQWTPTYYLCTDDGKVFANVQTPGKQVDTYPSSVDYALPGIYDFVCALDDDDHQYGYGTLYGSAFTYPTPHPDITNWGACSCNGSVNFNDAYNTTPRLYLSWTADWNFQQYEDPPSPIMD